jgi:hypothetical protein
MKTLFLLLIVSQTLHSLEEYFFELWEVFAPARYVSGLISDNLTVGFIVINTTVVSLGFWCYLFPVRKGWPAAIIVIWAWTLMELGNAVGHSIFALQQGSYFPGLITAIPLLVFSCLLFSRLISTNRQHYQ